MCNIQHLGLIASRLYIALLLHGETLNEQPKTKIMEMVGAKKKQSYSDACAELERWGFVRLERAHGVRTRVVALAQSAAPVVLSLSSAEGGDERGVTPLLLTEPTYDTTPHTLSKYVSTLGGSLNGSTGGANEVYTVSTVHPNGLVHRADGVVVHRINGVGEMGYTAQTVYREEVRVVDAAPEDGAAEVHRTNGTPPTGYTAQTVYRTDGVPPEEEKETLLDRCIEIDAMPSDGERTSVKGNFLKRRRAQMPLVVELWKEFFPGGKELITANVKELLVLCGDSLETLYEELEFAREQARKLAERKGVAQLEYAYGYAKKTIEGRVKERGAAQERRASPPSSAVSSRPLVGAEAYVPGGDLPPPSPAYLVKLKEAEQDFERLRLERGWYE